MTNLPRLGERYVCFEVATPTRGWSGPYGQTWRPAVWRCIECGATFHGDRSEWFLARLLRHHECGHAPCAYCGQPLLRRKDGTPRQHRSDVCPGKSPGYRIEREFAKNIGEREYA